jgi:hypothetical protein
MQTFYRRAGRLGQRAEGAGPRPDEHGAFPLRALRSAAHRAWRNLGCPWLLDESDVLQGAAECLLRLGAGVPRLRCRSSLQPYLDRLLDPLEPAGRGWSEEGCRRRRTRLQKKLRRMMSQK